jgi:hypothetical protein
MIEIPIDTLVYSSLLVIAFVYWILITLAAILID